MKTVATILSFAAILWACAEPFSMGPGWIAGEAVALAVLIFCARFIGKDVERRPNR